MVLVALVALVVPTLSAARPAPAADDKISPQLVAALDAGPADFWIRFDRADTDTAAARAITDWVGRGQRVVDGLTDAAKTSQAAVRRLLDARGVSYQSFWVSNAILVRGGTMAAATDVARLAGVLDLRAPQVYERPAPVTSTPAAAVADGVEWGVANINADDVWAEFGTRGEGVVVGNIDTGVQYDHPALVASYRGNNGDGTFTHDYNWLDTSGQCAGTPCDADANGSHGTHTMGTMVGSDGPGNQIGVAPGARWIAANGCAVCSDVDLVESAQWMLAPTDADGGNPDVAKRPHVINNSLGSRSPSDDPFLEDVLTAWADAGIFGVWANGNLGPSCRTSSSPGSRTINYSVGAYDEDNVVASFSSRGPGQDGETKPNIAAPGVAVRSASQGNLYRLMSGTSMATPHVTGAVALLWSADPTLVGDVAGTRALLDLSAVDTADPSCGGPAGDNNSYGEGRLDALALLRASDAGGTGTLTGTVTDAATGDPVSNATVAVTGPVDRETTTAPDGTYSLVLLPGDYQLTVDAFGHDPVTRAASITVGGVTTVDVPLTATDTVTVTGSVLDGSGHGWPLHARVAVDGAPDRTVFSDPYTGRYRLDLPANAAHTLRVTAQYPGYLVSQQVVRTGVTDVERDVEVAVDAQACAAPGYDWAVRGTRTHFDEPTAPEGWTVTDNNGNGGVWAFDDPGAQTNRTGGSGGFAILDGTYYLPKQTRWDSTLTSPVADLSDEPAPALDLNVDYTSHSPGHATGEIDLSLDGGATWENVWRRLTGGQRHMPLHVDLPQAANQPQVQVRFRYTTMNTGWWQIDDVVLGREYCAPVRGGLVAGQVTDDNTEAYLAGARVTAAGLPAPVTSRATPEDPTLPDGYYWLFAPKGGSVEVSAARSNYVTDTRQVNVAPNWVTRQDFVLRAGYLVASTTDVTSTQRLGATTTKNVRFTNEGAAPVEVTLHEDGGNATILRAGGPAVNRVPAATTPRRDTAARRAAPAESTAPAAAPWTPIANYPRPVMDNTAVTGDDGTVYSFGGEFTNEVFAFDPVTAAWRPRAAMGSERQKPAAAFVDGKAYVTGGWWVNGVPVPETEIYHPGTDTWTTGAPVPRAMAGSGVGVVGGSMYVIGGCDTSGCGHDDAFAYDTGNDTWHQIADYPEPVSWSSCGGIGGKLYCAGGVTEANGATTNAYVYDPRGGAWAPVADMPLDLWGSAYASVNGRLVVSGGSVNAGRAITNEGVAYDPASDAWTPIPNSNESVYRGGSACGLYKIGGAVAGYSSIPRGEVLPGYGNCGASAELPWLSADVETFTLAPGASVRVALTFDTTAPSVDQPGTYTGRVTVANDSPYAAGLDVTMNVQPPKTWGKLTGTIHGQRCDGTLIPLGGATVALDSWATTHTLRTDRDGRYALWLDKRNNPVSMIVALDGWRPKAVPTIRIRAGETTTVNLTLTTLSTC
ncbi:hypothetical protein BLA60_21420 [Actinophytocola xinjiangensis]|uniref:Peptidase S8/S53 domain-containing protein n=1 Tax=Actinophytocola xinjiangensis TaxID=485602 RepID=A0A7Z0WK55_9PSEU|nr:hypothetical protein BLA60_21420 [Actinophytocola xinjiangensis]